MQNRDAKHRTDRGIPKALFSEVYKIQGDWIIQSPWYVLFMLFDFDG